MTSKRHEVAELLQMVRQSQRLAKQNRQLRKRIDALLMRLKKATKSRDQWKAEAYRCGSPMRIHVKGGA